MRKHNEGYTLVLVMVVLAVLSVLATVILTAAERNLEAHKHGVQYMQNKYQAQGEIEKVVSTMEIEQIGLMEAKLIYDENLVTTAGVTPNENGLEITSVSGDVQIDCNYEIVDGAIVCTSYKVSTDGGAE